MRYSRLTIHYAEFLLLAFPFSLLCRRSCVRKCHGCPSLSAALDTFTFLFIHVFGVRKVRGVMAYMESVRHRHLGRGLLGCCKRSLEEENRAHTPLGRPLPLCSFFSLFVFFHVMVCTRLRPVSMVLRSISSISYESDAGTEQGCLCTYDSRGPINTFVPVCV